MRRPRRRRVPEVVQTSGMDCGPAALAALLSGCGLTVSYPRLRELCQTDVDGTSIDTLEELALDLGLDAEQVMLPADTLLEGPSASLPCIAVTRLPNGLTHFTVLWRRARGRVQVMDPAVGRRWLPETQVLESLYQHAMPVATGDWYGFATDAEFLEGLRWRLRRHLTRARSEQFLQHALERGDWRPLADLDALARVADAARRRRQDARAIVELFDTFAANPRDLRQLLPRSHYQVTATADPEVLTLHGAVLLRVNGDAQAAAPPIADPASHDTTVAGPPTDGAAHGDPRRDGEADAGGRAARAAALHQVRIRRPRGLVGEVQALLAAAHLRGAIPLLLLAGVVVGLETLAQGVLFRFLLDVDLVPDPLLLSLLAGLLLIPLGAGMLLDRGAFGMAHGVGRRIDGLLRVRLLERLPRMRDAYFQSRLVSDLAERGHAISRLRESPALLLAATASVARAGWIGLGLLVLAPQATFLVLAMLAILIGAPFLLYPGIAERDLRMQAHLAALGAVQLDALRGTETLASHAGEQPLFQQYETLLAQWRRTAGEVLSRTVVAEAVVTTLLTALGVVLVLTHLRDPAVAVGSLLLLAFWALSLPLLARELFEFLRLLPRLRNAFGRVTELFAPDELEAVEDEAPFPTPVSLRFRHARVERAQACLLDGVDLTVPAGQRVAVIGASGAGKSSLLDTLTGFQSLTSGELKVDGRLATPSVLARLREHTVLIDPELYLWNRSIIDNLTYGRDSAGAELADALHSSGLAADLSRLPEGLATRVGENGARLSGGEGQRVRIARGLLRRNPSLLLLDEPFRGMDREQRRRQLAALLARWPGVTTLCVTHDVFEAGHFDRVLVVEHGRIVEDGTPDSLGADSSSRYARLLRDAQRLEQRLDRWRSLHLRDGILRGGVAQNGVVRREPVETGVSAQAPRPADCAAPPSEITGSS